MAIKNIQNLISDLHDSFGDDETSVQQQQLMQQLKDYSHALDEAEPVPPNMAEAAELLLEEIEESYPKSAGIIREVINMLSNIGI